VIGWDSLRYFWSRKSPEQIANDLSQVIDTYATRWGASKVALIGYSFGAGIIPFAYDRLPREAKERVVQLSLLGFASTTDFEISIAGWLGAPASKDAAPTEPALASIDPMMIQCFYGEDESDSACPALAEKKQRLSGPAAAIISAVTTTRSPATSSRACGDAQDERLGHLVIGQFLGSTSATPEESSGTNAEPVGRTAESPHHD